MAGKPGTGVGRLLRRLLPSDHILQKPIEFVDNKVEWITFDGGHRVSVPELLADPEVSEAKANLGHVFGEMVVSALAPVNLPLVEGDDELMVEHGLGMIAEGYVNGLIKLWFKSEANKV